MTKHSKKRVVIIGGALSGFNMALNLVDKTPDFEVIIIKKEKHPTYSPCGMPFVMEGKIPKIENILLTKMEENRKDRLKIMAGYEVMKIDLKKKIVEIKNNESISYDKLVIATGRKPFIPPIKDTNLKDVNTLSNYEDGVKLQNFLPSVKKAVVIGAGPIGLECAIAFVEKGIKTKVFELLPQILPQHLDNDMAEILEKRIIKRGLEIFTSTKATSINGNLKVESVTANGEEIQTDLVLISTGIKPNVDLAKESSIEIGKTGGIIVDSQNHVKKEGIFLKDVYALGDCVEVLNPLTNQKYLGALASTAALQARVIAEDIMGREMNVNGYLSPLITVIAGLIVGSVGLTKNQAEEIGMKVKSVKVKSITRARYFPEFKEIIIKLHVSDEKIIGCQIISEEDVKERINLITFFINNEIKLTDIVKSERCFTPPLTLLKDPLIKAVEEIMRLE